MRVFTLSDIHVDFEANRKWIDRISATEYSSDILILAGDVSHNYEELQQTLRSISNKFRHLFFVPGNHDLWVRNEVWNDSIHKFETLIEFCRSEKIYTSPQKFLMYDNRQLWIIPIFSWYTQPGEGDDTLYIEKPGEDATNRMWSDNYFIEWPDGNEVNKNEWFLRSNKNGFLPGRDDYVISFSHFLPNQDMMFSNSRIVDMEKIKKFDRNPTFNFSRVAGSTAIDRYIRKLNSTIHIYGHQHINRDREIAGVRYVSHCLGYPKERKRGQIRGIEQGIKDLGLVLID